MGSGEVAGIVPVSSRELAERSRDLVQTGLRELPALLGKPIRLLIVDHVPEARHDIRLALQGETDIQAVGEAATGIEGLWRYKQLGPDVVCTGIDMPEMGGLTMTSRICQRIPEAKVFVLSIRTDPWSMESALRAGALDYLAKPVAPETFSATVRAMHRAHTSRFAKVLASALDGGGTLYTTQTRTLLDAQLRMVELGEEIPKDATLLGITFRDGCREAGAPPEILSLGDFRQVLSLPLAGLDFSLSNVNDQDVAGVCELTCIESLNLLGTQVGKDGAPFLESQLRLRYLNLRGTRPSEDAFQRICKLSLLEDLDLSSTDIEEGSLGKLSMLPALRRLHLEDNQIRGKDVVSLLSRMFGLRELFLGGNPIGPDAIQELARFILRQGRRDLLVRLTGGPLDEITRNLVAQTNAPGSVGIVYQCVVPPFSGFRLSMTVSASGRAAPRSSLSHSLRCWDLRPGPSAAVAEQRPIRVLIVDDHELTRDNIAKLLAKDSDIKVVGMARDAEEAFEAYRRLLPDVMTTCVCMPGMDGITMTEEICREHPDANIIIISVQSRIKYRPRAKLAGAKDYLEKPPSRDELIASIRSLAGRAPGTPKGTPED